MPNYDYLWKCWTVRTYNVLMRNRLHVWSAEDAKEVADAVMLGYYRNGGKKMAAELYRAAGLGVYEIAQRTGKTVEETRQLCERFDNYLHESLS